MKNRSFENYLNELTPNEDTNYSLWRAAKNITKKCEPIPPIRKKDGSWAHTEINGQSYYFW